MPLARDPVQLDELLRETFEDMQHLGQSENLAVTLTACEPVVVHGDRHRLRQLLLKLADNAVKYNEPHGRATLSLRTVGPEAELVFTNTGPGLPRDQQSRVFERFFRGDLEGSGLGLSIVEWIARAHGGSVLFESGAGTLTTVTVRVPVV